MAEKQITVSELKTFIEAVEFASDKEDWIPSERQWKRIRSMIDRLTETAAPVQPAPQVNYQVPQAVMALPTPNEMRMAPGGLGGISPSQLPGPFAVDAPQLPVRTPHVDTSGGKPYGSPFAG